MILPDLVLPSRRNQHLNYTGLDDLARSPNPEYFNNYPWPISYTFNSRGFRDLEWPNTVDELKNCIWCIGDSFTVGVGVPLEHTWPRQLETATGLRTINVSMDGASNNWIARRAKHILDTVDPCHMVVHWSFLHRREKPDVLLNDEQRRLYNVKCSMQDDIDNFAWCLQQISDRKNVIHSFIPEFAPVEQIPQIQSLLQNLVHVPYFTAQDRGRDSLHYDIVTAQYFVKQLVVKLA